MGSAETQRHQREHAQERHQGGLDGVDNQHERDGIGVCQSVEDEDGLHGKVPGTSAVGRRHDDRDASHDETDDGDRETEVGSEIEALEGDPVVQEIADPYRQRVECEQPLVLHPAQREDALLQLVHHVLDLLHKGEPAHENPKEHQRDDQTDGGDDVACRGESPQDVAEVGARLVEERRENRHLRENDHQGDEQDEQRVDDTLRHHRAQRLQERGAVVSRQHAAPAQLATARNHQAGGIGEEHGMDAVHHARMFAQRFQGLFPTDATKHLSRHAKHQREEHPPPIHLMQECLFHRLEVRVAVHPPQNAASQHEGQGNIDSLF